MTFTAPACRVLTDALQVLKISLPTTGMFFLVMGCETISLMVLGHIHGTSEEVSALGLGNSVFNCVALSIGFGFTSSLETTVTQARGADDLELGRMYLHRCQCWMGFLSVVCGAAVCMTEPILNVCHMADPVTARHAGVYTQWCAVGLFGMFQCSALRKYLTSHTDGFGGFLGQAACLPLHLLWCILLAPRFRVAGLGMAMAIKGWFDFLFIAVYTSFFGPAGGSSGWWKFWKALQIEAAMKRMRDYFMLAVPNILLTAAEWWAFEMLVFMAGYLHNPDELASHVTLVNVSNVLYLGCVGANKAASTLVGDATGRGSEQDAKRVVRVAAGVNTVVAGICGLAVLGFRTWICKMYSPTNVEVQTIVASVLPVVVAMAFLDGQRLCLEGGLVGYGRQQACSVIGAFCWWVVLPPTAVLLCFLWKLKVRGLWMAGMVTSISALLLNLRFYWRLNFATVHREAVERMLRDGGTVATTPLAAEEAAC
mmetsp:Transcript_33979/g.62188  ORF Transcript_33979/g.62188 Transcript_33979/m.62188 type:complete len:482 (+) Transcript_33979:73-1518(+)